MMTGVPGLIFWASRSTSKPSFFSILMSVITRSKFSLRAVQEPLPVVRFSDGVAFLGEEDAQRLANVFLVVHDQDVRSLHCSSPSIPSLPAG